MVRSDHPLRRFLYPLVVRRFSLYAGLADPQVADYVAGVLTDFVHVDNLYRIRNTRGRRLEDVAEMLIESNPLLAAQSFDRERLVRKHVGDFTLFVLGLFPESLATLPRRRPYSLDPFVDYLRAGKESYTIVAAFNLFEYRNESPLFRKLADVFEQCVAGLNIVKTDLEQMQEYRQARAILES